MQKLNLIKEIPCYRGFNSMICKHAVSNQPSPQVLRGLAEGQAWPAGPREQIMMNYEL